MLLRALRCSKSSEVITQAVKRIETSISHSAAAADTDDATLAMVNIDNLTSQKDWLLSICECIQCLDHSVRTGSLVDSSSCLSDASTNSYEKYAVAEDDHMASLNIYEEAPARQTSVEALRAQATDPLLNLVQTIMMADIKMKPSVLLRRYHGDIHTAVHHLVLFFLLFLVVIYNPLNA